MISTPCYCNRVDVQRAIDVRTTIIDIARVDEAMEAAARDIEENLHRLFYPWDGTVWRDWPNYQYAYPWRVWLDRHDLLCLTGLVTGYQSITMDKVFLRPANPMPGFPRTSVELDRASNAAFGGNSLTPQNAITLTGTWGFSADADQRATLPSAVGASDSPIVISDSSQISAGDLLILGYGRGDAPYPDDTLGHAGTIKPYVGERVLVLDVAAADTGQQQSGSGCSTDSSGDNQLTVQDGSQIHAGETLILDAERMLAEQVIGNVVTVRRAWDGTVLASHSNAEVYALRSLTVERGALGTTAAAWDEGTPVYKQRYPGPVRELAIALSVDTVLQQSSGYARTVGAGEDAVPAPGDGLARAWGRAATFGKRKSRIRVI